MRRNFGSRRVFVAIRIGDRLKKELGKVQRHLEEELIDKYRFRVKPGMTGKPGITQKLLRFVRPDQLHITLAFLGQISAERQETVAGICREAAKGIGDFILAPGQLGAFPRINRPAVVWVGLTGETKKLELLTKMLEFELGSRGIWPIRGTGGFAAHVTIARVARKHRRGQMFLLRELLENTRLHLGDIEIPVKEITIYQSARSFAPPAAGLRMTGRGGPEYLPIETIKL